MLGEVGGINTGLVSVLRSGVDFERSAGTVAAAPKPAASNENSPLTPAQGAPDASTTVNLSPAGLEAAAKDKVNTEQVDENQKKPGQLTPEETRQVEQLQARDREVRAHEQAHQAAAGGLATGGATYSYQRGPDGANYAVGGEVQISLREGRTPQETIANAQTIRAAALAPADPSPQDRSVAAAAGQLEARARTEIAQQSADSVEKPSSVAPKGNEDASGFPVNSTVEQASSRRSTNLAGLYGQGASSSNGFSALA